LQPDAVLVSHCSADVLNQPLDFRGRGAAGIDDEVGVLLRYLGAPDRKALQTRCLDQPRRVIAGRVPEYRSAARQPDRLGRLAPREQRLDVRYAGLRVRRET
jgi:hypothetical protein